MIIVPCDQGGDAWHFARLGIPTASEFDNLITSKGVMSDKGSETYAHKLLAEQYSGEHEAGYSGGYINRGKELEEEAAIAYAWEQGIDDTELEKVGFIMDDSRTMGCSPDRILKTLGGGLELKCPAAHTHMGYLINNSVGKEYYAQVQGCMLITGYAWWDVASYHPKLPISIVRTMRDEVYIGQLRAVLSQFNKLLAVKRQILINRGHKFGETNV